MDFYYDYLGFIEKIKQFKMQVEKMSQNNESNKRLLEALKDTIDFYESLNKLNQEEKEKYTQILAVAASSSIMQK